MTTLLELVGLALVVAGVAMVAVPAGVVAGGAALLTLAWRAS